MLAKKHEREQILSDKKLRKDTIGCLVSASIHMRLTETIRVPVKSIFVSAQVLLQQLF